MNTKRALNWATFGLVFPVLIMGLFFGGGRMTTVYAQDTNTNIVISDEFGGTTGNIAFSGDSSENQFMTGANSTENNLVGEETSFITTSDGNNNGGGEGNSGGGGGGGGGRQRNVASEAEKPVSLAPCEAYMKKFVMIGRANDPWEVKKLQMFLILHGGEKLSPTGVYDQTTINAVKRFQVKYAKDILTPWGLTEPTGHTFFTTSWTINNLVCGRDTANNFDMRGFIARSATPTASVLATTTTVATTTRATTTEPTATSSGLEAGAAAAAWLPDWNNCVLVVIILILVILWLLNRIYNLKQEIKELRKGCENQPPLDFDGPKG